ncbi:MAG: acyl-CoA dehydrogenase family protein [Gemmatimonadota bacterium]
MRRPSTDSGHAPDATDFRTYLDDFKRKLHRILNIRGNVDRTGLNRGLPPFMMREIQAHTPLSVFIPSEYGGRGGHVYECQSILEAASYESLALSLTIGINGALFLQPVTKYGQDEVKGPIFRRFIEGKNMGGLMITEPDYGTDALSMRTSYREAEDHYHVQGVKHWGGLTGWADFWLVTARNDRGDGQLARDIDFFIADMNSPGEEIEVEEFYENLGLYMIPYGRNRIDIKVPKSQRLVPKSTGIKMMLDLLHRSRTQFPGMGMGFLQRMMDEALAHCRDRVVGGKSLSEYDQVAHRLARLQAYFTTCSAMCAYASEHAGLEKDMATANVPANSIKCVATDFMQDASQSLLQLTGAMGYRLDHIAGRSVVDSRPFQVFEGPNDVLYKQIAETILRTMRRKKVTRLLAYLQDYELTSRAADRFKKTLDFDVDTTIPQRKLVDLGRVLGHVVSMNMVIELGDRGFRSELIANGLEVLQQDVESLVASYHASRQVDVISDYSEDSKWLDFVEWGNG